MCLVNYSVSSLESIDELYVCTTNFTQPVCIIVGKIWSCRAALFRGRGNDEIVVQNFLAHRCRSCYVNNLVRISNTIYTSLKTDGGKLVGCNAQIFFPCLRWKNVLVNRSCEYLIPRAINKNYRSYDGRYRNFRNANVSKGWNDVCVIDGNRLTEVGLVTIN